MDFLEHRILLLAVLAIIVLPGDLWGQQSNPFDIIKTNQDREAQIPYINENDSLEQDSARLNMTLLDSTEDNSINLQPEENTLDSSDIVSMTPAVVDENNPFNIVKTSGPFKVETPETIIQKDVKPTPSAEKVEKSSTTKNNWIPQLKPRKEGYKTGNAFSLNFIFWIIVASLLVLTAVINLKRKSFLNLYRAITNDNYLKLLQREENNGFTFFFLLLYIIFLLNAALYIYQLLINKFELGGYKLYLSIIAGISIIYFVRYIGIYILQIFFPLKKEARQFNFTIIMFNIIVGLLLIPINILIAYASFGPTLLYSGLGVIVIFYLLRQLRGLFIAARTKGLSYFHFFIYLCSFEVAPIFWLLSFLNY